VASVFRHRLQASLENLGVSHANLRSQLSHRLTLKVGGGNPVAVGNLQNVEYSLSDVSQILLHLLPF
jgi:hypothetical protein